MKLWLQEKWKNDSLFKSIVIFLVIVLGWSLFAGKSSTPKKQKPSSESWDTFIPPGKVLVPIEVENYHSLDRVLGHRGVVNLHLTGRSLPVAQNIPILKSPHAPHEFAVLVSDKDSSHLVRLGGPFRVAVQNPTQRGTKFVKPPPQTKRRILKGPKEP